jgi:hypothetical protein
MAGPARGSGGLRSKSISVPCLWRQPRAAPAKKTRLSRVGGADDAWIRTVAPNPPDVFLMFGHSVAGDLRDPLMVISGVTTGSVIWLISRSLKAGTKALRRL